MKRYKVEINAEVVVDTESPEEARGQVLDALEGLDPLYFVLEVEEAPVVDET